MRASRFGIVSFTGAQPARGAPLLTARSGLTVALKSPETSFLHHWRCDFAFSFFRRKDRDAPFCSFFFFFRAGYFRRPPGFSPSLYPASWTSTGDLSNSMLRNDESISRILIVFRALASLSFTTEEKGLLLRFFPQLRRLP